MATESNSDDAGSTSGAPADAAGEAKMEPASSLPNASFPATAPTLTLRLLMMQKDVGSIIGKSGATVKTFREESGARINISDAGSAERIVTISGPADCIFKAVSFIAKKFEEDHRVAVAATNAPIPPVSFRLVMPASQCGPLIGKKGTKIKEIRDVTSASVQVASEMLPGSTERTVTISGTPDSITQCIYQICCVMLEHPPKGPTIPYRPRTSPPVNSLLLPGLPLHLADPTHAVAVTQFGLPPPELPSVTAHSHGIPPLLPPASPYAHAAAAVAASAMQTTTTQTINIPNDLIGCLIGKRGAKITEIRQLSGAQIKISDPIQGVSHREVTICGSPDRVQLAQYLINNRIHSEVNAPLAGSPLGPPMSPLLPPTSL
ncbi:poly(rC)-binding protein 3-like isoform X2 [Corticium candelabrum]|uniref:poly(rC)-binding protein 3-like isoform X2 n=1 Tax=Corticium candelabrum TaxID=121492 RepID=UPI002E25E3C0|nr:poly(rC)-binding protein 3-like isoform X2 [Corticium candelabrum]